MGHDVREYPWRKDRGTGGSLELPFKGGDNRSALGQLDRHPARAPGHVLFHLQHQLHEPLEFLGVSTWIEGVEHLGVDLCQAGGDLVPMNQLSLVVRLEDALHDDAFQFLHTSGADNLTDRSQGRLVVWMRRQTQNAVRAPLIADGGQGISDELRLAHGFIKGFFGVSDSLLGGGEVGLSGAGGRAHVRQLFFRSRHDLFGRTHALGSGGDSGLEILFRCGSETFHFKEAPPDPSQSLMFPVREQGIQSVIANLIESPERGRPIDLSSFHIALQEFREGGGTDGLHRFFADRSPDTLDDT